MSICRHPGGRTRPTLVRLYASAKPLADRELKRMSKEKMKRHNEELQRRILELIQDFEMKTDWRVETVAYNPATSTVRIAVKQPH